ncbi:MAG: hypothetical protein QOJ89_2396 [bacterium]|jgi:hypothetical protein
MNSSDKRPITVRDWLAVSALTIGGLVLGLLSPKTFFARDDRYGPVQHRLTMPIRVLVYPVSFLALPALAAVLITLAWALVLICAPVIWARRRGSSA